MKKQSVANSQSQPDSLTFFIDCCLGQHIVADALRSQGCRVEIHNQHFPEGTKDSDWLNVVGNKGWVILTKDKKFRYRLNEARAVINAKARAFVLTSAGDMSGTEIAEIFIKAIPHIKKVTSTTKAPFIAHIGKSGSVTLLKTKKDIQNS